MTPKQLAKIISGKRMSFNNEEGSTSSNSNHEEDFVIEKPRDRLKSSRGSRFDLLVHELNHESVERQFSREGFFHGVKDLYHGLVIHPENNRSVSHSAILNRSLFLNIFKYLEILLFDLFCRV